MKILFLNTVGAIGGAERVLLTIFAVLRSTNPDIQIHLIACTEGPLIESAQNLGVCVQVLKMPEELTQLGDSAFKGTNRLSALLKLLFQIPRILPAMGQYLVKFRRSLRELAPDIIHSNGIKTHLLTALAGETNVPVVWHIHDFYGSRPLMARALKWTSSSAAIGIAISEAVAADARVTLPDLLVEVIYNAVDVNYFSPEILRLEGEEIRKGIGGENASPPDPTSQPSNRPLRVGLVATFARWKGHDIFLEAAERVVNQRPDLNVHFYIIGGPIYSTQGSQFSEQELRDKAAVLQIKDKVDFWEFQSDIAKVYRWLDITVHASTQPEPFGLAIVEAMACSKPVIVSQAGGAAELFTHHLDAMGVEPGDPAALASAIQHLADSPDLRKRLSENARQTALRRFSQTRLSQQILLTYEKLKALSNV